MLRDQGEVPDAPGDDELLLAAEVLVGVEPRARGGALGIEVQGEAGAIDLLLLVAPPRGVGVDLESSERSGRVMLRRSCWPDAEPKYIDNSERLSASLSWVVSAA